MPSCFSVFIAKWRSCLFKASSAFNRATACFIAFGGIGGFCASACSLLYATSVACVFPRKTLAFFVSCNVKTDIWFESVLAGFLITAALAYIEAFFFRKYGCGSVLRILIKEDFLRICISCMGISIDSCIAFANFKVTLS